MGGGGGLAIGGRLLGLAGKNIAEMLGRGLFERDVPEGPLPHTLSNTATREWYHDQLEQIPSKIDKSLSLKEQALQAFKLRNDIKSQARELMADQALAKNLPPVKTLRTAALESYKENIVGDRFWQNMINGSQRTNITVDDALSITNRFAPPRYTP
ncbi:hypothetical protein BH10PSE19_BH10PSE19_09630 [soil metagenome]